MKNKYSKIISIILALFTVFAIGGLLKIEDSYYGLSNSIISILILVASFHLFNYVLSIKDKRLYIIALLVGFVFSGFLVCGRNLILYDYTFINTLGVWVKIILCTPLLAATIVYLFGLLSQINSILRVRVLDELFEKRINNKLTFFISWVFIFVAWIPGLIASYPGVYGYDSVYQVMWYQSGKINTAHPLIHTCFLGFCVENLGNIFGSKEAGFFCYSLIQMLCLSALFAVVCYYMAERKCAPTLRIGVLSVIAFSPINAILSFSSTKDVLFAGFFCLMMYCLMRIAEGRQFLSHKKNWILTIFSMFGMMIFRSQGIYVVYVGVVCGVILLHKQRIRLLIISLVSILLFNFYSGPITVLCNGVVEEGNTLQAIMSVPVMQMSRAVTYNSDQMTEAEIELIEEYIPDCYYYEIGKTGGISDVYKWTFNEKRLEQNLVEFIMLWVKVGIKCPVAYIDAFARLTIGLWYPDMNYCDDEAYHPYWEYENTPQREQEWTAIERNTPVKLQWLSDLYYKLTYENAYQKIPVISMLFSSGFFAWLLLLYIAWCFYYKRYTLLFPASFLFAYWLTLLLGPVVLLRYVYPLMTSMPILFIRMITTNKSEKEEGV